MLYFFLFSRLPLVSFHPFVISRRDRRRSRLNRKFERIFAEKRLERENQLGSKRGGTSGAWRTRRIDRYVIEFRAAMGGRGRGRAIHSGSRSSMERRHGFLESVSNSWQSAGNIGIAEEDDRQGRSRRSGRGIGPGRGREIGQNNATHDRQAEIRDDSRAKRRRIPRTPFARLIQREREDRGEGARRGTCRSTDWKLGRGSVHYRLDPQGRTRRVQVALPPFFPSPVFAGSYTRRDPVPTRIRAFSSLRRSGGYSTGLISREVPR